LRHFNVTAIDALLGIEVIRGRRPPEMAPEPSAVAGRRGFRDDDEEAILEG
jgi:hypothetical protein